MPSTDPKPGATTSEFWTIMGVIAGTVTSAVVTAASGGNTILTAIVGGAGTVLGAAYVIGRSWIKAEHEKRIDLLSEEAEAIIGNILNAVIPPIQEELAKSNSKT